MKESGFHRLQRLRMENDEAGFRMDEMRERFETLANRHRNGTAPRAVTAHQLFQTPPELAAQLVALLDIQPGSRVLEPSAGLGRLLDVIATRQPAETVAVEVSPDLCRELFVQDRERVTIKQRDFLTLTPAELGTFDAVAMNPPFHMRADIRHITHALSFLKPGGTLAALMLDTRQRYDALHPLADTWQPIAAGTFRAEGTNVPTVLATFTK